MEKIKIAINGADGRMGQEIKKVLEFDSQTLLVAQRTEFTKPDFSNADAVIDFSSPDGLEELLLVAKCPIMSGTTGIGEGLFQKMKEYGNEYGLIWGSNASFGVNLVFAMVKKMASFLGEDFDAEVYERHHRFKKDAPSGTAISIGKKIAEGRGALFQQRDYSIQGERKKGEIGFSVERGGKTVGFHEVRFVSDDETIWIGHEAHERSIFAKGAVKLAKIAVQQNVRHYYEAWEVLMKGI